MSEAETIAAQAQTANNAVNLDQQVHDRRDIEVLYKIYKERRIESQASFYESRVRENQLNADFTFTVGAAVMTISSLIATISAAGNSPVLSLLSAILPAFAALLASFRQLYGWERQISIYRDALLGLERVKLMTPDKDRMPLVDLQAIYPKLVNSGESVFTGEVNQWGQFVQRSDKADEAESTDTRSTNALMGQLQLSDEQIDTIRKIVAAGAPKPAFSQQTITVHPEEMPIGGGIASQAEAAPPAENSPVTVTTTRVDTTVVEHVIPAVETPVAEPEVVPVDAPSETQMVVDETHVEPIVEHEPPPPEAMSALTPGAMHVDAPQAPPENPNPEQDPNANG